MPCRAWADCPCELLRTQIASTPWISLPKGMLVLSEGSYGWAKAMISGVVMTREYSRISSKRPSNDGLVVLPPILFPPIMQVRIG